MELRHLRYFLAVAEEGTLSRAADRLGIQQPPLGQQIRALEEELKVALFDRSPKRVALNAAGEVFLQDTRRVLAAVDEMVLHVRRFARGEQGKLAAGFTSSASLHPIAPRLIRSFRAAYPRAEIDVEERETYELLHGVEERRLDAAFVRVDSRGFEGLEAHRLDVEPLVAAIPAGHPLAADRGPLAPAALQGARVVMFPRASDGPGFLRDMLADLAGKGVEVEIGDAVQRILSALNLVAAGRGVTFVPQSLQMMHRDAITYRPLPAQDFGGLPLWIVHRSDIDLQLARNFIAIARQMGPGADGATPVGDLVRGAAAG